MRTALNWLALGVGSGWLACVDEATPSTDVRTPDAEVDASAPAGPSASVNSQPNTASKSVDVSEEFLGAAGDGWKTLITARWELEPGTEGYRCQRYTLPEDVSVGAFRGLIPNGTHHAQLWIADDGDESPDGSSDCTANTISNLSVSSFGVGTNAFEFPEGVASTLKRGQQLLLNLHLFNVTDESLSGLSGTLIRTVDANSVVHEAELFLPGAGSLAIPPGGPTVQTGECTLEQDAILFAVAPHMHQTGVHMRAVANSSVAGEIVLSDRPFSFDEQLFYKLEPTIQMKAGDTIHVECTFVNNTNATIHLGNSTLDEMCFASSYRYPAVGKTICVR